MKRYGDNIIQSNSTDNHRCLCLSVCRYLVVSVCKYLVVSVCRYLCLTVCRYLFLSFHRYLCLSVYAGICVWSVCKYLFLYVWRFHFVYLEICKYTRFVWFANKSCLYIYAHRWFQLCANRRKARYLQTYKHTYKSGKQK